MNRSRALDRRYRRILAVSLGLSVGIHALLLAFRFEVPLLSREESTVQFEQADAAEPLDEVIEVLALAPLSAPVGPVSDAAPAAPAISAAGGSPAAVSSLATPVPRAVVADIAFEELKVFDPLSNGEIEPVAFTDLPEAVTNAAAEAALDGEAEDDVPVYVPGSIGKAKRQWGGGAGTNTLGDGSGPRVIFGGGGGNGGHCPMPGRVPPIWK